MVRLVFEDWKEHTASGKVTLQTNRHFQIKPIYELAAS